MTNEVMTQEEIMQHQDLFISQTNNDIELLRSTAFSPNTDLEEFFLDEFVLTKETILALFKKIISLEDQVKKLSAHRSMRISANADLDFMYEDEFNNNY